MPIQIPGVGSGLGGVVDQLVAAERVPIQRMEQRKQNEEARLQLVNDLESKVGKVRSSLEEIIGNQKFKDYALDVSDPSVISGSVSPEGAVPGQWDIEVIQLADNSGALSNPAPDRDKTKFGVGYLKFDTPDGQQDVYINDSNNTLDGISKTINQSNLGISATVVEDGSSDDYPFRLILSSDYFGNKNDVYFPTIYLLDGEHDLYFDVERESQNGIVKVNGFAIETVGNQLEGVIPGVDLSLKSAQPGKVVNISLTEDLETIEGKLQGFVDSMNSVLGFVQTQSRLDANSDTSRTLGGDSLLRSLEGRVRRLIQQPMSGVSGNIRRLNQLGVEFNRYGTLDFKKDKFVSAVKTNSNDVLAFFRGDNNPGSGFIGKVKGFVQSSLTSGFGVVNNRKRGIQSKIDRIDRDIESKEKRLEKKEVALRRKFSKLEEQLGKIRSQGAQVAGAFGGGAGPIPGL